MPGLARLAVGALLLAGCATRAGGPSGGAFEPLFANGLDGWAQQGGGRFTVRQDGSVRAEGGRGVLWHERVARDFELELEWKADTKDTDSGVLLRADTARAGSGYQIQIRDDSPLAVYQRYQRMTGAIDSVAAPTHPASRPAGEWNRYRIVAAGQWYRVWLNGELVNELVGSRALEGRIGLESPDSGGIVFRNVRVRALEPSEVPAVPSEALSRRRVEDAAPIRVLVVTATHGFRHTEAIDASKEVLPALARTTEMRFDITDSASAISPENLARYDVLFLNNATLRVAPRDTTAAAVAATRTQRVRSPLGHEQERAIADFVRGGKGIVLTHAALDAMYGSESYREMAGGGLFVAHPWVKPVRAVVEATGDATVAHFGREVWVRDEIYTLDTSPRATSRVLLAMDVASAAEPNADARRTEWPPAARRADQPLSWIRRYGEGRVFATVLGHFGDVWHRPDYQQHLLQGIRVAAGRLPADFGPR